MLIKQRHTTRKYKENIKTLYSVSQIVSGLLQGNLRGLTQIDLFGLKLKPQKFSEQICPYSPNFLPAVGLPKMLADLTSHLK